MQEERPQVSLAHLGSSVASSTTSTSGLTGSRVQAQKLDARLVSLTDRPTMDLNHWRSFSTRLTMAMGVLKMEHTCRKQGHGRIDGLSAEPVHQAKWEAGCAAETQQE